jgi:hypothetical protein
LFPQAAEWPLRNSQRTFQFVSTKALFHWIAVDTTYYITKRWFECELCTFYSPTRAKNVFFRYLLKKLTQCTIPWRDSISRPIAPVSFGGRRRRYLKTTPPGQTKDILSKSGILQQENFRVFKFDCWLNIILPN